MLSSRRRGGAEGAEKNKSKRETDNHVPETDFVLTPRLHASAMKSIPRLRVSAMKETSCVRELLA
jgi:hypothetical protein